MGTRRGFLKSVGSIGVMHIVPDLLVTIQPLYSSANQPLGTQNVPHEDIARIAGTLERVCRVRCVIEPAEPLPEQAYYEQRNRYRSEKLVHFLNDKFKDRYVLGIASVDISTTVTVRGAQYEDWGIIGQAQSPGTAGIVSSYRCKRDWLEKAAVHEFSHMLGLGHCNDVRCNLRDVEGIGKRLDKVKLGYLCSEHSMRLPSHLRIEP